MEYKNNDLQKRETLWKNSQLQEIKDPLEQMFSYKPLKKDLILRAQNCTIYRSLMKIQEMKGEQKKIKDLQFMLIKKYQFHQRNQSESVSASNEYKWLKANPKYMDKYFMRLIDTKKQQYCFFSPNKQPPIQSTLYDKLKYGVRQFKEIKPEYKALKIDLYNEFKSEMIERLTKIHSIPAFLGGLRPCHIGVSEQFKTQVKKSYSYPIIDFGLVNLKQATQCIDLYDPSYLAPEYKQGSLSQKSDYWSFGCILYELVSNGQKFINNPYFHDFTNKEKQQFIEDRLKELACKIMISQAGKYKFTYEAVGFLDSCLKLNPKLRELGKQNKKPELLKDQFSYYKDKIIFDISMEIFRLTQLQDNIISVFEEFYFNKEKTVKKMHVYPLLRFASCYYLEAFNKLRDKARSYGKSDKWDKYSQVRKIQDERKITDIKDKAAAKMIREMEQDKVKNKEQIFSKFPQIKDQNVPYPRTLYHLYWDYVKDDLCRLENKNFFKFFYNIHFYMKDPAQMQQFLNLKDQIRYTKAQAEKDPQIIYFQLSLSIADMMQDKIKEIIAINNKLTKQQMGQQMRSRMLESLSKAINKIRFY